MQNKWLKILFIGAFASLMAACGIQANQDRDLAAESSKPEEHSQQSPYKEWYKKSVFLGDSITEGLSYHDVLNEENVLAGAGKTAEFTLLEDDIDNLVKRKPEQVFIHLGSTDILWPTDDPQEHSLTHYAQLIHTIKKELPKAKITLLSVAPVTAEAEKGEPRYGNIEDYNEGLKALAAKEEVGYVDITSLVNAHSDLYDTDGIHFQAEFYPILLDYLKDALID